MIWPPRSHFAPVFKAGSLTFPWSLEFDVWSFKGPVQKQFRPLFLLLLFALCCCASGADWPHLLGPQANGISDEVGLLDKFPTNGPPVLWAKEIGTGYSAPSILGQRLVLHHRLADEEIVECFQATNGLSLWRYACASHFIDPY